MGIEIKYHNFLKESNEKGIREKVRPPTQKMILSDRFKEVLYSILNMKASTISKRLLELETSKDKFFDVSYVDVDTDGENVTYLQSGRIERLLKMGKPIEEFWTTKMRTKQKIGRFITQVIPKFNANSVQKFSNKFKTIVKEFDEASNFEIVEGDDIVYWYNSINYDSDHGSLGGSYMSEPECGQYLNCYRKNPDQCKMLILKNKEGDKIKGRAIVWKLSTPKDKIFMDRVYTNVDEDELLFINYAKKQGWLYKNKQIYGGIYIIVPKKGSVYLYMEATLSNTNFVLYPYVDTLRYYYSDLGIMASDNNRRDDNYYTLSDTEGHYEEYKDPKVEQEYPDPMMWDAFNGKYIPEYRSQWCKPDNAFTSTSSAIRLSYNNTFAFPNSPNVVFSEYTKKLYTKDDCVFSKPLNTWIWKKYSVPVYHDKNKQQPSDLIHRFELNKTIGKVGDDYYDIDLLKVVDSEIVTDKTEYTYAFKD